MRKKITEPTLKALFAKSGNKCAFPDCDNILVHEDGGIICQVCHIEAASPQGERYNPQQTDEERRHLDNLILLCPQHHIITNDESIYTVEVMRKMKCDHELKYEYYCYEIDQKVLSKISADMEHFWYKIEYLNTVAHVVPDLAMEINGRSSFFELIERIREDVSLIEDNCESLRLSDESLDTEIRDYLNIHNIDLSNIEKIPYYENPFVNRNWEIHCLANPNYLTSVKLQADLIELKYLHLYLLVHTSDMDARERMKMLKKQVEEYASQISHND